MQREKQWAEGGEGRGGRELCCVVCVESWVDCSQAHAKVNGHTWLMRLYFEPEYNGLRRRICTKYNVSDDNLSTVTVDMVRHSSHPMLTPMHPFCHTDDKHACTNAFACTHTATEGPRPNDWRDWAGSRKDVSPP